MEWADELTLISTSDGAEDKTNEHGFYNLGSEIQTVVFANRLSVGMSEFYKSAQAGVSADLKFEVMSVDYDGQLLAEYDGYRYCVLRAYTPKNSDKTELTLTDIRHEHKDGDING